MKNVILIFTVLLGCLSSCSNVLFETSQPKDVNELEIIPKSLIGVYIGNNDRDTLRIYDKSFHYSDKISNGFDINDTLKKNKVVLKPFKEYFILSLSDNHNHDSWTVFLVKQKENKLFLTSLSTETSNKDSIIKKLKEITNVKEAKNNNGKADYIILNPTIDEFEKIIKSGLFTEVAEFTKIK